MLARICVSVALFGCLTDNVVQGQIKTTPGSVPATPKESWLWLEQIYDDYVQVSLLKHRSAIGDFLIRNYESGGDCAQKNADHVGLVTPEIRKAATSEVDVLVRLGQISKSERDDRIEQKVSNAVKSLADELAAHCGEMTTRYVRFLESGAKFRTETMFLDNERPLLEIRDDVLAGKSDLQMASVTAWDGIETSQIVRSRTNAGAYSNIRPDRMLGPADVFSIGRLDVQKGKPVNLIRLMAHESDPPVIEKVAFRGETAVKIILNKIGNSASYLEFICLPKKGYAFASVRVVVGGKLLSSEVSGDFTETSLGFWFPSESTREWYNPGKDSKSTVLARRTEFVAINPPKFNTELDDSLFHLNSDPRFTKLSRLDRPVKAEKSTPVVPETSKPRFVLLWIINGVVVLAILAVVRFKRRQKS